MAGLHEHSLCIRSFTRRSVGRYTFRQHRMALVRSHHLISPQCLDCRSLLLITFEHPKHPRQIENRPNTTRAFIIQFPLTLLASLIVALVLHLPPIDSTHWLSKLRRIDFLGAFTLILAISSLLIGLDRGSNTSCNPIAIHGDRRSILLFL